MAQGGSRSAATARRAAFGAQLQLGASLQRRRDFDARQVGIPLVRGLGPGLSRDSTGAGRPGLCQDTAPFVSARMVPPSERADSGVRMVVQRRESAGPRLGVLAR